MTDESTLDEFADLEIAFEFRPADAAAADLVRQTFAGEEIFESNAFTGAETLTMIFSAARNAINKVLGFFAEHRKSFNGASIKIGTEEISLTGYTMEEVRALMESGVIQKHLRELKK
jgi:hypothetical protein